MYKFFPALLIPNTQMLSKIIYCDNAGGSQIPIQVINSLTKMLTNYYVQPFANNNISKQLTDEIHNAKHITNIILNSSNGYIIYSSSSTQNVYNLANSMKKNLNDIGGEIILADFNHESMLTPFERLFKHQNIKKKIDIFDYSSSDDEKSDKLLLKWWHLKKIDNNYYIDYSKLYSMINEKTRLVVIPHVSNILGNILDIKTIIQEIRRINPATKIMVDGVAYMAHGKIDVIDLDVDFYLVSFYKFCGLRVSALYIRDSSILNSIENQNHYFIPKQNGATTEKKLEIGGINYENLISINGIGDYFRDVANTLNYNKYNENNNKLQVTRKLYEFVIENFNKHEKTIINIIDKNLEQSSEMRVIEDKNIQKTPLYSIKFKNYDVKFVELVLNALDVVCKSGKFYSDRLLKNIDEGDVLRISFMHYNNLENIHTVLDYLNMFKRLDLNFILNLNNRLLNSVTVNLKASFNNLEKDHHYNVERNRAFSLLNIKDIDDISIIGDIQFYQSRNYNNYNGDIVRNYSNIDISILQDSSFKFFIKSFKEQIDDATSMVNNGYNSDYIFVHQIRVYASDNSIINLVPEGIHRDGYNIVGMCIVNRENIQGGISNVYDNEKRIVLTQELQEGEMLIINDAKMYHDVTPIKLHDKDKQGYRDIFVFTTIS